MNFLAVWCVLIVIFVMFVGFNLESLNSLLEGGNISEQDSIELGAYGTIFIILMCLFLVPSIKNNISSIINKSFEFPNKIMNNFFK